MKCCNNNGRYLNEQTYLDTVCNLKRYGCGCAPPARPCKKYGHCFEYTYRSERGKLTLRCDERSAGINVEVNFPKPPCN